MLKLYEIGATSRYVQDFGNGRSQEVFWEGPGWYAPVMTGHGWSCTSWTIIPGFDKDGFSKDGESRVWDVPSGRGTPFWADCPEDFE